MRLPDVTSASLTVSFRFGPMIAAVANTVLFAKEHSPQTEWCPYRLRGNATYAGLVTHGTHGPLCKGQLDPLTVVARKNSTLMIAALELVTSRPSVGLAFHGLQGTVQCCPARSGSWVRSLVCVCVCVCKSIKTALRSDCCAGKRSLATGF